ncbi:sulfurtransferase complex subunit TusB [Vibrio parahaemolyticus]|uniref:sulfurtransferase complex subunit TusB n=1 Tax=Vibrio parahaemolyticus TaxID=670 RepID=UPI0009896FA7|nr:sulfurtransferase complex subunit TusB [Vibrio parahaemolyticus]OOQ65415.1 sulfurtransferase TusB [Vibrio parahaemolyticus]OOQ74147.1 sulfurtransferase TusB [Vibrio parahaemolyticus]QEL39020.1 sulfurtransferase complex subunit TusB [Vibrio parahaemolyticus]
MLHIIKTVSALEDACALYSEQDAVLLIEDAVYAANPQHKAFSQIKHAAVFALKSDIQARGMANRIGPSVTVVDYVGFVELTAKHDKSLTWD